MKKNHFMLLAAGMLAVQGLVAAEAASAPKSDTCTSNLSADEQAFAGKLSERQRKMFCAMSAEQRKAAMTASVQDSNMAVEQVMKDQHLTVATPAPVVEAKVEKK
jgi:hypothetical protein